MSYKQIIVNPYTDSKEQGQFDTLAHIASRYYENRYDDVYLLGNVRFGGHALDALLMTRKSICVLEFKNYEGLIRVAENLWTNVTPKGEIEVKGGSSGKTPRDQAEINNRGVIETCAGFLGRTFAGPGFDRSRIFPVAIIFNHPVRVEVQTLTARPKWLNITQNGDFLAFLKMLDGNPEVFTDYELSDLIDAVGVAGSCSFYDPHFDEARKMFERESYARCLEKLNEKKFRGFMEADFLRAACRCELDKDKSLNDLVEVRLSYNCTDTLYYEAKILYEGKCGERKNLKEAKSLAQEGASAGCAKAKALLEEICYDESRARSFSDNKNKRAVFLAVLTYVSLPLVFAMAAVCYLCFPDSLLVGWGGAIAETAVLMLPLFLSLKKSICSNLGKWLSSRSKRYLMECDGKVKLIKKSEISYKVLFYIAGALVQVLPFAAILAFTFMLSNLDWVKEADTWYFPLHTYCRIVKYLYHICTIPSVALILERCVFAIWYQNESAFTLDSDYQWEVMPNFAMFKDSFRFAWRQFRMVLTMAAIIVVFMVLKLIF